jgi:dolichyl-diphosphooligosaccharide--protein glycosyltransferase
LSRSRCKAQLTPSSFPELYGGQPAQDRVRGQTIPTKGTHENLETIEEAFTSENWIVRIYAVRKEDPFGRAHKDVRAFEKGKKLQFSPSTAALPKDQQQAGGRR